jgi:uncharacterized membrane protein (Fun14 family)
MNITKSFFDIQPEEINLSSYTKEDTVNAINGDDGQINCTIGHGGGKSLCVRFLRKKYKCIILYLLTAMAFVHLLTTVIEKIDIGGLYKMYDRLQNQTLVLTKEIIQLYTDKKIS